MGVLPSLSVSMHSYAVRYLTSAMLGRMGLTLGRVYEAVQANLALSCGIVKGHEEDHIKSHQGVECFSLNFNHHRDVTPTARSSPPIPILSSTIPFCLGVLRKVASLRSAHKTSLSITSTNTKMSISSIVSRSKTFKFLNHRYVPKNAHSYHCAELHLIWEAFASW